VVYVTVTFAYVVLIVLFIRFITLPGSLDGFFHFMRPNMDILYDLNVQFLLFSPNIKFNVLSQQVWGNASIQVFYSLSTCTGGLITLASYNRFHNNIFTDIWVNPNKLDLLN
jgi:solute carrier family 6 (neurotransmitter transporter, glycine) member 5/9